jgi:hypothetical protein
MIRPYEHDENRHAVLFSSFSALAIKRFLLRISNRSILPHTHHAEGLVNPKVRAKKDQIKNRSLDLPLPTFFKR